MKVRGWGPGVPCVVVVLACGTEPATEANAALEPGILARVGVESIHVQTVRRIAGAQQLGVEAALDRAIADAVFANAARTGAVESAGAEFSERVAHARALLTDIRRSADALGPPDALDLARVRQTTWWEYDRPVLTRTLHAAVLAPETSDRDRARQQAKALGKLLAGVTGSAEFRRVAESFDAKGLKVRVEALDPVAPDGRVAAPEKPPQPGAPAERYELPFAVAAAAIESVGEQSPVIETSFGFHVLLATERLPEQRYSDQVLREMVDANVRRERARQVKTKLVEQLRASHSIEVDRAAENLMALVRTTL